MSEKNFPRTLQQAVIYFSDEQNCVDFVAMLRWPNGAVCPRCESAEKTYYLPKYFRWNCSACRRQFSVKTGTIFEDSPIPLNKWVVGVWLIAAAKNGISSYEVHRALGITQKAAWHMMHRARLALHGSAFEKMGGNGEAVEVDETYIGGAARFMHKDRRKKLFHGGGEGKLAVFGLLERHAGKSRVKAHVVPRAWQKTVNEIIKTTVEKGALPH